MRVLCKTALPFLFCGIAGLAQNAEKLSLNDAITIALNNNPDLLAAQKEIEAASGRVLQAGRIPNPELSVTFNEVPTNFSFGDAGEKDIGLSQPIEFQIGRAHV